MVERARRRRLATRFILGAVVALVLAEGTARIAEALGPTSLRWYDASTQLKIRQMEDLGAADVVFAGTSMAWQGFVPSIFTDSDAEGRSAFNAGLAGGVPQLMEPWLLDQVEPRLRPGLVVWGLTSMDLSASYGSVNLDRYQDALETRSGWLAATERLASDALALVRYRAALRSPDLLFGPAGHAIEDDFASAAAVLGDRGERRDFRVDVGAERAEQVAARLADYRLDHADLEALFRAVVELRDRGVDVVLAELPVPSRYRDLHPGGPGDLDLAHRAITAVAGELEVPVFDLRHGFGDDDFVDFTHLGEPGAAELTRILALRMAPGSDPLSDSLIATTVRASRVHDELFSRLGGVDVARISRLWMGMAHYGQSADLAVLASEHRVEVLFVGTSMMAAAADPELFTSLDGRVSFNVGHPGTGPEINRLRLAEELVPGLRPELVVYGVAAHDLRSMSQGAESCMMPDDEWHEAAALRARLFAPVTALAGIPPATLLYGDPPRSTVQESYHDWFSTFGQLIPGGPDGDRRSPPVPWANPFEPCPARLDAVRDTVAWLSGQGTAVVLVALPVSDALADQFAGKRAEVDSIVDEFRGAVDVPFLDYSDLIEDDQFWTQAHVDGAGADAFTRQLVSDLGALGL